MTRKEKQQRRALETAARFLIGGWMRLADEFWPTRSSSEARAEWLEDYEVAVAREKLLPADLAAQVRAARTDIDLMALSLVVSRQAKDAP
jgi:hypothetical protein